jgi:TolB-like protein
MMRYLYCFIRKTSLILVSCWLILFSSGGAPAREGCEKSLGWYADREFDQAIKIAYHELQDSSSNPDSRLCAYHVLGISYYAKGVGFEDSVKFYLRKIVQLNPQYAFDPNDYWPPPCRKLLYAYQQEWREAHPSLPASEVTTLAILPFENRSIADKETLDPLTKGLADMLTTELSQVVNLKIVERERLQSLLDEMGLDRSPLVDESTAVKVGKILGAQSMLFGSFMKLDEKHMRIDVRIIQTETAQLIKADKLEGDPQKLFRMVDELALKVAQHLNVAVSALERKRLEGATERSWDAVLQYSQGLRYEDEGDYRRAYQLYEKAWETDPGFVEAERKMYNLMPLIE